MASYTRVPAKGDPPKGTKVKWVVRYRPPGVVNPRQRTVYSENEAKLARAEYELIEKGIAPAADPGQRPTRRTVNQVFTEYLDTIDVRPAQRVGYRVGYDQHVAPVLGDEWVDALQPAEAQRWVQTMQRKDLAAKTIANLYGTVVKPTLDFAHERGYRGPTLAFRSRSRRRSGRRDGAGGIIMPRRRRRPVTRDTVLLPDEAPTFLAAAYNIPAVPADLGESIRAIAAANRAVDLYAGDAIAFLYLTGLRWSEFVPIQVGDFALTADPPVLHLCRVVRDNRDGLGDVVEDDEGKSESAFRDVLLSDYAAQIAARRISDRPAHELAFLTQRGRMLEHGSWWRRRWAPAVKRAAERGITKKLTPHKLRHGYATALIDAGVGLDFVCAQLGHADETVTQTIYVHITKTRQDAGRRVIDQALRPVVNEVANAAVRRAGRPRRASVAGRPPLRAVEARSAG